MKVIGYVRVSSKKQVDGYSLKLQKDKIKEYCKFKDYDLIETYEDRGISGMSIDKREGYKDMVSYLRDNNIDGVVVWSLSRLGRRMKDVISFLEDLKSYGISFYSIKEGMGNDDKISSLIMNILSSINEFEVETIRERIRDVKREKKSKMLVYGKEQYGFNNVSGKIIKNDNEFRVVKRVKNLRTRGWSWRRIAIKLNADGIVSKEGNKWYDGSLYNVMRSYNV
mgnify:FL=1